MSTQAIEAAADVTPHAQAESSVLLDVLARHDISQAELAKGVGLHESRVSRMASGAQTIPMAVWRWLAARTGSPAIVELLVGQGALALPVDGLRLPRHAALHNLHADLVRQQASLSDALAFMLDGGPATTPALEGALARNAERSIVAILRLVAHARRARSADDARRAAARDRTKALAG